MRKIDWRQNLKDHWLALTIKNKIYFFVGVVGFIVIFSVLFDMGVAYLAVHDFETILEDNARNCELMEAMENESSIFYDYVKAPSDEKQEALRMACAKTIDVIRYLPDEYVKIGEYRYAKTWSIRNSYKVYAQQREQILKMEEDNPNYIQNLYQVYEMQDFLKEYARVLMTYTLKTGTDEYLKKVPYLRRIPALFLILGALLLWGMASLSYLMYQAIIVPIVKLVNVSKKIIVNDFQVEDVKVANRDEMGELVKVFNKMKEEMRQYIKVLEEKREMANLLHKEELMKLEVEKRLEATKFEVLKNQMNPHFLFNSLNVISGMANLESANVTEKMTKALSDLFRYNLKTFKVLVPIAQELRVARDYMYLQQMRFGSRIDYEVACTVDIEQCLMPSFCFQPLIENAIIHGLSQKEEGGKIYIRIWEDEVNLWISVKDTGMGMSKERVDQLISSLAQEDVEGIGIGLGNIYRRVHTMYQEGEVMIFSELNVGTTVQLKIPKGEKEACDVSSVSC